MKLIRIIFLLYLALLFPSEAFVQNDPDSAITLKEVAVEGIPNAKGLSNSTATVSTINESQLNEQPGFSLVPALNSVPGIRMEERSPGSYRLSIRGSLLRSPFGIRNIKFYIDNFPFTDAGGNTYLNLLDPAAIKNIQILKGPEGSLFGANTGGVVLIELLNKSLDTSMIYAKTGYGSFGLLGEHISFDLLNKKYRFNITGSFQKSDGYRGNSNLRRSYFQNIYQWTYRPHSQLKLILFYADLRYRTPGGLTLEQFKINPKAARPGTSFLPGAIEQKAGVYNQTFYYGLSHEFLPRNNFRHITMLFSSKTNYENPFITNYEKRDEASAGIRTYIELEKIKPVVSVKWNTGIEGQITWFNVSNYGNRFGSMDTLQTADKISVNQGFLFTQFSFHIYRWIIEASVSLNNYQYKYQNIFPIPDIGKKTSELNKELLPRLGVSYKLQKDIFWRISASRGYSPPSVSEIRSSDNTINNSLRAESGWNFESGLHFKKNDWFEVDFVLFRFDLENAIVRRVNNKAQEYFINAGSTKQQGMELQLFTKLLRKKNNFKIHDIQLRNSVTYYDFSFTDYKINNNDYSDNRLTGVPAYTIVSSLFFQLPAEIFLFLQHNYTGRIPLNDANSEYASPYNLVQIKTGWKYFQLKWNLEISLGIDNLLNQKYSLGNDLNAAGGRYYNPAPGRNYFCGITIAF